MVENTWLGSNVLVGGCYIGPKMAVCCSCARFLCIFSTKGHVEDAASAASQGLWPQPKFPMFNIHTRLGLYVFGCFQIGYLHVEILPPKSQICLTPKPVSVSIWTTLKLFSTVRPPKWYPSGKATQPRIPNECRERAVKRLWHKNGQAALKLHWRKGHVP